MLKINAKLTDWQNVLRPALNVCLNIWFSAAKANFLISRVASILMFDMKTLRKKQADDLMIMSVGHGSVMIMVHI